MSNLEVNNNRRSLTSGVSGLDLKFVCELLFDYTNESEIASSKLTR